MKETGPKNSWMRYGRRRLWGREEETLLDSFDGAAVSVAHWRGLAI